MRPLHPGVRLTAIFDSCHSGTALDLPYVYSTQGILKEPNLAKEAALDLFSALQSYGTGDLSSVAHTAIGFFKKAAGGSSARERTVMTKTSPADVVMFSGSKDTQTSCVFLSLSIPLTGGVCVLTGVGRIRSRTARRAVPLAGRLSTCGNDGLTRAICSC